MYLVERVLCEGAPVEADVARHGTLPGGVRDRAEGSERAEAVQQSMQRRGPTTAWLKQRREGDGVGFERVRSARAGAPWARQAGP